MNQQSTLMENAGMNALRIERLGNLHNTQQTNAGQVGSPINAASGQGNVHINLSSEYGFTKYIKN